ncbi:hypothetical protein Nepgr_015288 [Nepenthes gracilis]|uniref:AB hydrolase-1 domain-containing protein n=1 Tax=Nepenthes gracilis TaxID=150966 RepID=A0AAD3SLT6_NEPGR|nr:hypothetical protein Nepgr_015288 [Nepenthes gracilis]
MVGIIRVYSSTLHKVMKVAGIQPRSIEIEPGSTIMNFWVPSKPPSAEKPAVVLIHGFAVDGILQWQFQVLALMKKYSVYVPDLIFFGRSTTSSSERSAKFQADSVAKGLEKLGVERCMVVGFSYGGIVAFQMAEHHPELVVGMVVTGTPLALTESFSSECFERLGFSRWADYLLPNSAEGVKVLLEIASYQLPWLPNFFCKDFLQSMLDNRLEKAELLEALLVRDEEVTTHQFLQRIHILHGEGDKIFPMEVAEDLKKRLGVTTELRSIKKAGHLCLLERPCVFNKYLEQLLASLQAHEQ